MSKIYVCLASLFVLLLIIISVFSIYQEGALFLPGLAPTIYRDGESVQLMVNKITSVRQPIPYRFNDLPVCPTETVIAQKEDLGSIIMGNRIETSPYLLKFKEERSCSLLCSKQLTTEQVIQLQDLISFEYKAQWLVDDLPAVVKFKEFYDAGFLLGEKGNTGSIFFNHVHLLIHYHKHRAEQGEATGQYNIVLFEVHPYR
eukprot:TRINITY_DN5705_c0_g2_i2.p1 TRINITY_DN5705_c0_g2~~TRINITY_DN5705_c0_g2_i2.p1  ORF type:complete len:201 (-),score=17.14 TRINITY_DN5705_c0_g2_i2:297-899(-)